ncbi:DUF2075 domain-containing protein [uncultured Mucilaginibacter sp.]|uniref:DUF2075 domain-containing protein n=1 Tax=uncultured Mucilaginibacter sp. TaxID=797541 RepID=UPI0025D77051|nr:DUF2075 domain-containing protein [uncultured Mucilaginibacter sp.]
MGAFYINAISQFINETVDSITGKLTRASGKAGFYQQMHSQTASWEEEISLLQDVLTQVISAFVDATSWGILLEYPIARRSKRIDVVLICNEIIVVIEFKAGRNEYTVADQEQLLDYCLDLRDFHFQSRGRTIVPLLLATNAKDIENAIFKSEHLVQSMIFANSSNLAPTLLATIKTLDGKCKTQDFEEWDRSNYSPTPTIIEAAQTLYSGKSVIEISRSHAEATNLTKTTTAVINAIKHAKGNNKKIICFITGVPGAGKTLAGLDIAHHSEFQTSENASATFLSGNGPLIKVLREALKRDSTKRLKQEDKSVKAREQERIIAFIENVHRFIDAYFFDKSKIPNTQIVIFDEAQRAWNAEHSLRKFNRNHSEPEMMFEVMNRHEDWAVIVALVGGGQEINTGEAGLPEWGRVIAQRFNNWTAYISPELKVGDHSTGNLTLFEQQPSNVNIIEAPELHLSVSIRSYKAEGLSRWVNQVLTNNPIAASDTYKTDLIDYNIIITRDLNKAKQWLKDNCLGSRRMGLVASSGARRLRPYGLEVRTEFEEPEWFLNPRDDIRSSYYLEIPATEFGVQGLELDWTGVCWDGDLRRQKGVWEFKSFKGSKWLSVSKKENQTYIINKYRVLLTRAREGMVIFVPQGDNEDPTRNPQVYNDIANYLVECGVKEL